MRTLAAGRDPQRMRSTQQHLTQHQRDKLTWWLGASGTLWGMRVTSVHAGPWKLNG